MKRLAFILTLFMAPNVAAADTAQDLIGVYNDLNEMCRGWSGDDPHTDEACAVREKVGPVLNSLGWCLGKKDQSGAEMAWHRCGKNSLRYGE